METRDWIPVMVPPAMAPRVLREVASYVAAKHEEGDGPQDWSIATEADRAEVLIGSKEAEWHLLVHLAGTPAPTPAADLAASIGLEIDDLAGLVGWLNKRAKRAGWVSPVQTRTMFKAGQGSIKGLVLHDALGWWVAQRENDLDRSEAAIQAGGRLVASSHRQPTKGRKRRP